MGIERIGGCYKCMKYTLVAFNLLVLIIGGAMLGLGIFALLTDFGVTDFGVTEITGILGTDLYKAGIYLLITGGAVTALISFFGCCGAAMESRCLLGLYFAVMLILTIFFLAVCIIGFVFRKDITGHLKKEAETSLVNKYGPDQVFTDRWDKIQMDLKCCGLTGDVGSNTSWAIYKLESWWFANQTVAPGSEPWYVPDSCCDPEADMEECVGRRNGDNQPPKTGPPVNSTMGTNPYLYTEGCYDMLEDYLDRNALIIGGIALAALFIMVLGVIFSICLCTQIGKKGYVV